MTAAPSCCKGKHEIGCILEDMTVTVYSLQIMTVQLSRAQLHVRAVMRCSHATDLGIAGSSRNGASKYLLCTL